MGAMFQAAIRGRLEDYMRADANALARVHTNLVRAAGARTKRGIQNQLKGAVGGERFQNTIRFLSTPLRGFSTRTTVRVFSKARYGASPGRRTKAVDLLELYSRGETVTAQNGKWLAIPTQNAPLRSGRGGARKAQPSEAGVPLVFIRGNTDDKAFLVTKAKAGERPLLMYVLVRQTRRSAMLNPDAVHRETLQWMTTQMQKTFIREDQRMRREFGSGISIEDR